MKRLWIGLACMAMLMLGTQFFATTASQRDQEYHAGHVTVPTPQTATLYLCLLGRSIHDRDAGLRGEDYQYSPLQTILIGNKTLLYYYVQPDKGEPFTVVPGFRNGAPYQGESGCTMVDVALVAQSEQAEMHHQLGRNTRGQISFWESEGLP